MKYALTMALGAMLLLKTGEESKPLQLGDPTDRASYSLGHQIGRDLAPRGSRVDSEAFRQGLVDGLAGAEPALDPQEMQRVLGELKRLVVAAERRQEKEEEARLRQQGQEFLADNLANDGVVARKSGLQYRVIRRGSGKKPGRDDRVVVHYRGTTIGGREFHDSRRRPGTPETLHVSGVIRGMSEALQLMKVGAEWRLFIPPDLAYGRRGPLADQTVIVEIELIAIEPGR